MSTKLPGWWLDRDFLYLPTLWLWVGVRTGGNRGVGTEEWQPMHLAYALPMWQWGLALLVPAGIFALYFLKLKRKPIVVPSTFLWKKSIEDLHVNSLWQRLRQNLLLWLQLLLATLLLVALLRPQFNATTTGRNLILLIDNSCSMSATDLGETRLEVAKQRALELIDQMTPGDHAMVISFNDVARVVCSYTNDRDLLRGTIRAIPASQRRTDLREALTIAGGLANPQRAGDYGEQRIQAVEAIPATVYLLSDGNFSQEVLQEYNLGRLRLHYLAVGQRSRNMGIVGLAARPMESKTSAMNGLEIEVFVSIRNFSDAPMACIASLKVDGQALDFREVNLPAGEVKSILFPLLVPDLPTVRQIAVELDAQDDLLADNRAWTVLRPPRQVRTLVVGADNLPLHEALATPAMRELSVVDFQPASFAEADLATDPTLSRYDLIIFDRCSPKSMPETNTYFIGALPTPLQAVQRTEVEGPIITNLNQNHPITRFLQLDDVEIVRAFHVPLPPLSQPLLEDESGALLFVVLRGVHTDLVQTFAIVDETNRWQTNWPFRLSFPVYLMNVIRTLGGFTTEFESNLIPGQPIIMRSPDRLAESMTLTLPDKSKRQLNRSRRGLFEILETDQLGIYQARWEQANDAFAVNLFDERESNLLPTSTLAIGATETQDSSDRFAARWDLWRPITLLILVFLFLEWYIYNRRVYI